MFKRPLLFTTLLLSAGYLTACGSSQDQKNAPTASASASSNTQASPAPAALTVHTVLPRQQAMQQAIQASGNIVAWQEASIGAEVQGLRITEVLVNVGDWVKKGQVLATFEDTTVYADRANLTASLAEAEALLKDASQNATRYRALKGTGAVSEQQISQILTAEETAKARVASIRANMTSQQVRLKNTRVVASDDGVISARFATVGSVAGTGSELFRLIRGGRLEWQGEVTAVDRARVQAGMPVTLTLPSGQQITGKVRSVAPTVNAQTRASLVYVDLPSTSHHLVSAGMFASGRIQTGIFSSTVLPQQAVVVRDGFSYIFEVLPDNKVKQHTITVGQQLVDHVEVKTPLAPTMRIVSLGAGFLNDGDTVRIVP